MSIILCFLGHSESIVRDSRRFKVRRWVFIRDLRLRISNVTGRVMIAYCLGPFSAHADFEVVYISVLTMPYHNDAGNLQDLKFTWNRMVFPYSFVKYIFSHCRGQADIFCVACSWESAKQSEGWQGEKEDELAGCA